MDIRFNDLSSAAGARQALQQMEGFRGSGGRIIFSRENNQITGASRSSAFWSGVKCIFSADYRNRLRESESDLNELLQKANQDETIGELSVASLRRNHYDVSRTIFGVKTTRRGIAERVTPGLVVRAQKMAAERGKLIFSESDLDSNPTLRRRSFREAFEIYNNAHKSRPNLTEAEMDFATALKSANTADEAADAYLHLQGSPQFAHSNQAELLEALTRTKKAVEWVNRLIKSALDQPKGTVEESRAAGKQEAEKFVNKLVGDPNKLDKLKFQLRIYDGMRSNAQRAAERPGYKYKPNKWQAKQMTPLSPNLELARYDAAISVITAEIGKDQPNSGTI